MPRQARPLTSSTASGWVMPAGLRQPEPRADLGHSHQGDRQQPRLLVGQAGVVVDDVGDHRRALAGHPLDVLADRGLAGQVGLEDQAERAALAGDVGVERRHRGRHPGLVVVRWRPAPARQLSMTCVAGGRRAARGRGRACRGSAGRAPAWRPRRARRCRPSRRRGSPGRRTPRARSRAAGRGARVAGSLPPRGFCPIGVLGRAHGGTLPQRRAVVRMTDALGARRDHAAGNMEGARACCPQVHDPDAVRPQEYAVSLPPLVEPAAELTIDEVRRYSRHLIIPDVGMDGQKRLKNAKVLVIGAGGLGSPALLYLAAAGVGTIGIAEFDEVDESNLQRQIIHGQSDIGKSKAQSRPRSRSPRPTRSSTWSLHEERLDNDNVMRVFEGYDLIVDGTDNFATRYMVNDAAYFLEDPLRLGLDLPLRRPGQRVRADPERRRRRRPALLPLPLPRAAAAGHGAQLRRGRRARRALRQHRLDPGQRGDQAADRHRRPAGRQAGDLRRPGDGVPQAQGPQGPELRAVRRAPDRHRADRLRDLLRRGLRGGVRGRRRLDDLGHPARAHAQGARRTASATSCWSTCASRTSTRSTRSPARC